MPARRESRTSSSPALLDESEWIDFSEVGRLKDFQPPSSGGAPLSVNSLNFSQFCFQKPVYQWYVDLSRSQKSKLITTQKITDVCGARHRGFQCDLQRILRPTQRCSDRSKRRRLVVFEHLASSAVTEDQRTNPSIQVLLVLNFMTAFIPKSFGWVYPCWVFVEYEGTSAWTSRKTKNTKTSKSQKKLKQSVSKHSSFGSMSCLLQRKAEAKLCLGGWDFYLSGMLFCWMPWYFASSNATVRRSHVITFQPLHLKLLHK